MNDYLLDLSKDASLNFCDFRKIHHAFWLLKQRITQTDSNSYPNNSSDTIPNPDTLKNPQELSKIKSLVEHRDNEIKILVSMIKHLQSQIKDKEPITRSITQTSLGEQMSRLSTTDLSISEIEQKNAKSIPESPMTKLQKSIPRLTTEKAKAFEIFKSGYPSGPWIDGQKSLLKTKYTQAKALGESAQQIRNEISMYFKLKKSTH